MLLLLFTPPDNGSPTSPYSVVRPGTLLFSVDFPVAEDVVAVNDLESGDAGGFAAVVKVFKQHHGLFAVCQYGLDS